jgi:hypothetical protein
MESSVELCNETSESVSPPEYNLYGYLCFSVNTNYYASYPQYGNKTNRKFFLEQVTRRLQNISDSGCNGPYRPLCIPRFRFDACRIVVVATAGTDNEIYEHATEHDTYIKRSNSDLAVT